jgi:hypothetical protein
MAMKQGGLLMSLGKRILGFGTASTGCCAGPAAEEPKKKAIAIVAPEATDAAGSCCAPTCCSADAPAEAGRR